MNTNTKSNNGDNAFEHSGSHLLEYFSKAGSFKTGKSFYENAENHLELFKTAWRTGEYETCMKLLFWTRDIRGGAGSRKNFRDIITDLANQETEWVKANLHLIPIYGRWDDLLSLYNTPCESAALDLWANALLMDDPAITPLAAKWADRQDVKRRQHMGLSPKAFRKMVVAKTGWVVEKSMCSGNWEQIEFGKVPSVAMARLRKAFSRHDGTRFGAYITRLAKGEEKVNASALFPHDVIRSIKSGGYTERTSENFKALMTKTFEALPNYIEDPNIRIMSICDFSGSMDGVTVSGSVTAADVALGLGLYTGDKLGKDNPFYRKLIPFSSSAKLVSWADMDIVRATEEIPDGYVGSTNIKSALDALLTAAKFWSVPADKMITTLLILSDMQFDHGGCDNASETVVNQCMQKWVEAGYKKPSIVYWNLSAYKSQPATFKDKNVALVSGFSPSILKHVLANADMSPLKVMLDTISKYEVNTPESL